jgi:citrate lyase subunit beta/citryl-CoA lyase
MSQGRPLRSLLFVPGNKPRMLEKARALSADAVILDLEDAVPAGEKTKARDMVREALEAGRYGPQVIVRINALTTGLAEDDLRAVLVAGLDAVCLPKAETAAGLERTVSLLSALEQERGLPRGGVYLLPLIETALGVLNAFQVARADHRVRALCLGGEDLCRNLGAVRSKEGLELAHARAHLVLAARAAGVLAVDKVHTDLHDTDGLLADARQARQLGFSGKLVIHPSQIEPVHHAFLPSEEEVAHAFRVLQAFEAAEGVGEGVIALDGQMIDAPVVARAREVLSLAKAVKLR